MSAVVHGDYFFCFLGYGLNISSATFVSMFTAKSRASEER